MRPISIAVHGDVTLNIIDGSAIWLAALVQFLHRVGGARITVLRKAPERRDVVTAELADLPRVRVIGPTSGRPLTPEQALDELERVADDVDVIVRRGAALCRTAADRPALAGKAWAYLGDIQQDPAAVTDADAALYARSPWLDDSLERSTKVLEYGAAGVLDDRDRWELARDRVAGAAADSSDERSATRLAPHRRRRVPDVEVAEQPTRALVACHDPESFHAIAAHLERCGAQVRWDLGLLGWIPVRKRLDRALDVVERLAHGDARRRLRPGGLRPWEPRWGWRRQTERAWFAEQSDRVPSSPVLPVIWPWETAERVDGRRRLYRDTADTAQRMLTTHWDAERAVARAYARERYPVEPLVSAWADLVRDGSRTGGRARAGVTRRARRLLRAGVAP